MDINNKLNTGVVSRMYPYNLFVYSAYWGTWSRVLRFMNKGNTGQVEVNLTATNLDFSRDWDKVASLNIRLHGTSRDAKDLYVKELPANALGWMRNWLDAPVIERLLHEDFLPKIDWELYNKNTNGGCPFEKCSIRKDND